MTFIIPWMDVIWLVLAAVIVQKNQRLFALGFVAACMLMMRLQVELMVSIGHSQGIVGLFEMHVFYRGLAVYSVFYMLYLILAHYSTGSKPVIFLAASVSIFFIVLFVSTLFMVL